MSAIKAAINAPRIERLRTIVGEEIGDPYDTDRIYNRDVRAVYCSNAPIDCSRFLACTSEGTGESSHRQNPDFALGSQSEVERYLAASYMEGWAARYIFDLDADDFVEWEVGVSVTLQP